MCNLLSKKSPFKESGLFEDADTIVKFRDDFGKPFVLTVLVVGLVASIYWFSQPTDDSGKIDQQIAGGDILAVIGIVFVVLLILELVGVTDIFKSI